MKTACVVPRHKKKSLDPDELSSYRPISNLSLLSKTLEMAVAAELNTYLTDSNLFSSLQSAYRRYHSVRSTDLQRLEKCAADIKSWSVENFLILNDSKTEILHLFSNFLRNLPSTLEVKVGNSTILPQGQVKDLGVFFDKHMNHNSQISSICSSASIALPNIGRLVHAFVSSRLDNCNSLLFGLPLYQIERLQRIQNTAARVVTLSSIKEHITPISNDLHWLTIHNRIKFKLLLLTYKALNGFAPTYLSELIQPYKNQRNLRSNNQYLLRVPKSRTTTFGDRAFSVCAPKLWNNLPTDITSSPSIDIFKKNLKTYLFSN